MSSSHLVSIHPYNYLPTLSFPSVQRVMKLVLTSPRMRSTWSPHGITSWMLSTFADVIAPSLASLYNLSIYTGQIPTDWKLSNVVPIPKESNKNDVRLFRPISLLPVVSKVLERHLHQLLMNQLLSRNVLSDMQFGFRRDRSTIIPLLAATHQWHLSLEKHHKVACVFFNFAKAFESVFNLPSAPFKTIIF